MQLQQARSRLADVRFRIVAVGKFREFRIGQERRVGFLQMVLEQTVEVVTCQMEKPALWK